MTRYIDRVKEDCSSYILCNFALHGKFNQNVDIITISDIICKLCLSLFQSKEFRIGERTKISIFILYHVLLTYNYVVNKNINGKYLGAKDSFKLINLILIGIIDTELR